MEYSVQKATLSDVKGMAICHTEAFPEQFMTAMGQAWLEALYAFYINDENGISIIAIDKNKQVLGLAVGGNSEIREKFLACAKKKFLFRIAWKCFTKKIVRKTIWAHLLSTQKKASPQKEHAQEQEGDCGSLLSIGITKASLGQGVAVSLMQGFTNAAADKYKTLRLTVVSDNDRAIAFYNKMEWKEVFDNGTSKGFHYYYS